ncbi:MAG: hypothetical protein KHZ73_00700 [Lachnospiraceae bacterium]|nr:hypothetical protein [Lachnospiraceae bacterium]
MKRLTAIEENGNAFYPYCFREDTCFGAGESEKCLECDFAKKVCETLAAYENTGLTPEEVDREEKNALLSIEHTTGYKAGALNMANTIEDIIRKHMNDGWIPVEDERLWDILFEEACVEGEQAKRIYNRLKETFGGERSEMDGKF